MNVNAIEIAKLFGLILTVVISFPAFAKDEKDCYGFINTLEIAACYNEQLKIYDTELNTTYQSIMVKLKARGTWGSLQKAQREWISYRDQNCEFHSDLYLSGSGAGPAYVACKFRMTKERLDELSAVLEDLE